VNGFHRTNVARPSWRRRASSLGVVPSIRRKVRVICAASENPAQCAASVTLAPRISSPEARCSLSQRTYGRRGTPTDRVKTCMKRERDRPATFARFPRDAAFGVASCSRKNRSTRLTRGCIQGDFLPRNSTPRTHASTSDAPRAAASPIAARQRATACGLIRVISSLTRSDSAAPNSLSDSTKAISTVVSRASTSCLASGLTSAAPQFTHASSGLPRMRNVPRNAITS